MPYLPSSAEAEVEAVEVPVERRDLLLALGLGLIPVIVIGGVALYTWVTGRV